MLTRVQRREPEQQAAEHTYMRQAAVPAVEQASAQADIPVAAPAVVPAAERVAVPVAEQSAEQVPVPEPEWQAFASAVQPDLEELHTDAVRDTTQDRTP